MTEGQKAVEPTAPTRGGYDFEGWYLGDKKYDFNSPVTGSITLTAHWSRHGGGGTTYYTLSYDSNGGTEYKDERYRRNTVVKLDKEPTRKGYTFTGWYADRKLTDEITSIKMTGDKTVYAGWAARLRAGRSEQRGPCGLCGGLPRWDGAPRFPRDAGGDGHHALPPADRRQTE